MRYTFLFLLIATLVLAFVFADQFPRTLARYPGLQEANRVLRDWLGMDIGRSSRSSEGTLQETDRILRKEASGKKQETKKPDLTDYYDDPSR